MMRSKFITRTRITRRILTKLGMQTTLANMKRSYCFVFCLLSAVTGLIGLWLLNISPSVVHSDFIRTSMRCQRGPNGNEFCGSYCIKRKNCSDGGRCYKLYRTYVCACNCGFGSASGSKNLDRRSGPKVDELDNSSCSLVYDPSISRGGFVVNTPLNLPQELLPFKPVLSSIERYNWIRLLKCFAYQLTANNISFFVYGGSALGAYHFGDMLPWDDDLDVMISYRKRKKVKRILNRVPGFRCVFDLTKDNLKFFSKSYGHFEDSYHWPYPSLDIFQYAKNGSTIYDHNHLFRNYRYSPSDIFPLRRVLFANMLLPAPRNLRRYVNQTYTFSGLPGTDYCISSWYHHKTGARKQPRAVKCTVLRPFYNFTNL